MTEPGPLPQTFGDWLAQGAEKAEAMARASRLFNDADIDRILSAVGKRYWPPTLNRAALAAALEGIAKTYRTWRFLDHQPPDGEMRKRVERINSTAKKLGRLLPAPDSPGGEDLDPLMKFFLVAGGGGDVDVRRAIEGVWLIKAISDQVLRDKLYDLGWAGRRSAERWLISDALPGVYTTHFSRRFGITRSNGRPSGPGIRFVETVLSVMNVVNQNGKPFQPAGIEYHWRFR
jgi:hypothetical protein